jgi:hypothetical protein
MITLGDMQDKGMRMLEVACQKCPRRAGSSSHAIQYAAQPPAVGFEVVIEMVDHVFLTPCFASPDNCLG